MIKYIFLLSIALLFSSCANMKSGKYVLVQNVNELEKIAQEYQTTKDEIIKENQNKEIKDGTWVYIPNDRGLVDQVRKVSSEAPTAKDPRQFFSQLGFLWPVPSSTTVSSNFGWRWGRPHQGMDIAARVGANIVAAADGVVVYQGDEIGGYGNITVLAHKGGYFTVYAHAEKNFTREGQRVFRGQVIATVGMTGRTYGPHLHFEVRKNGEAIDPEKYLANNN